MDDKIKFFCWADPSYSQCSTNADKKRLSNSIDLEERNSKLVSSQQEVEAIVSDILSARFPKVLVLFSKLMLKCLFERNSDPIN